MNFAEQEKITLKSFKGIYANGTREEVPFDHFVDSRNNTYKKGNFGIRPGSSLRYNIGFPVNDFTEWVNGTTPKPILSIDSSGNFYLNNSNTPLYTVTGATDFFTVNYYSKLFICPCNSSGPIGNLLMLYYPPSVCHVTAVSISGTNAVYSYTLVSGQALTGTPKITISGMNNTNNDLENATITALGTGTFTVVNALGVNETDSNARAIVYTTNNPTIRLCAGLPPTGTPMVAADGAGQTITTTSTGAKVSQTVGQSGSASSWSNLTNVQTDDGNYATVTLTPTGTTNTSNQLLLTNFKLNMPASDFVSGIKVTIHHKQISGNSAVRDGNISLLGVTGSNNYFNPNSWSGDEYWTYGSETDTWGLELTPDQVNSSSFGITITVDCTAFPGSGCVGGIDYVTLELFYTTSSTGFVPEGTYQIDVVYETDTGFFTPPAPDNLDTTSTTASNAPLIASGQISMAAGVAFGASSLTITLPNPPTVGNTLLFFATAMKDTTVLTPPAGLTLVGSAFTDTGANLNTIYVYKRIAQSGDSASWTFGYTTSAILELGLVEVVGSNTVLFSFGGATPSAPNSAISPALPAYTKATVIAFFTMCNWGSASFSIPTTITPSSPYNWVYNDGESSSFFTAVNTTIPAGTLTVTNSLGVADNPMYAIAIILPTTTTVNPNVPVTFTAIGDHTIELSNIPTGPTYTIARHIIITLPDETSFFFVPTEDGGVLNDNTTTTTSLNFFLTDLVESADYLFTVRSRIPAGQGINVYASRLVLWGFPNPDDSILRLSDSANPETFDETLETVIITKDDGYIVTNTDIIRDVLYIIKSKGISSTTDNGQDPVNWNVITVDQSIGTSFRGVSTASPTVEHGTQSDLSLIADISGVYLFNGIIQQPALTWKIQDLWDTITDLSKVSIIIDVKNQRFHITGFDSGSSLYNLSLVGHYLEGITPTEIKWDLWTYHTNCNLLDTVDNKQVQLVTLLSNGNIIYFDATQFVDYIDSTHTSAIDQYALLGGQEFDIGSVNLFTGIKLRVTGSGLLHLTIYNEDSTLNEVLSSTTLSTAPGKELAVRSNFKCERGYFKLENDTKSTYFKISRLIFYGADFAPERPS